MLSVKLPHIPRLFSLVFFAMLSDMSSASSNIGANSVTCSLPIVKDEMFYLTTQSTHFIFGYMASYIW